MKRIANVQLETNEAAFVVLRDTLDQANRCANRRSEQAWKAQAFGRSKIHKLFYRQAREQFPELSSPTIVGSIAKVSDSFKLDRKAKRKRRLNGSIAYDPRILSWRRNRQTVPLWTTRGRVKIPYRPGERQREMLEARQGEPELALDGGQFYLAAARRQEEPAEQDVADALGVDLGVSNLATGSDRRQYGRSGVKNVRHRHRILRRKLHKTGTKSAKRRLRNLAGQEKRFAKDVNHVISKKIVAEAHGAKRAIALEDFQHIRGSHFLVAG